MRHIFFYQHSEYPRDCKEVFEQCQGDSLDSGVYYVQPIGSKEPFEVYCNNSVDGGGWTVLQRRMDGSLDFYRYWADYKNGFGFLNREFWLGNDKIALLTNQKDYELRIDMNDRHGAQFFAKYDLFRISDEYSKYKLVEIEGYDATSTVGIDRMTWHKDKLFSTRDQDNDAWDAFHCAEKHEGAWWFANRATRSGFDKCSADGFCEFFPDGTNCRLCSTFHPNANYSGTVRGTTIFWDDIAGGNNNDCGMLYVEMKIRPV